MIAPGYEPEALRLLRQKKDGRYLVLAVDPGFEPPAGEMRTEFGLTLRQDSDCSNVVDPDEAVIVSRRQDLAAADRDALLLAMIVAKHTISNAVVLATPRETVGIGAGQQSRIDRMNLVDIFLRAADLQPAERRMLDDALLSRAAPISVAERVMWLGQQPSLCLASDAFIPFRDNVDRAAASGVGHVMQTGGSRRHAQVTEAADEHDMVMLHCGARYFLH